MSGALLCSCFSHIQNSPSTNLLSRTQQVHKDHLQHCKWSTDLMCFLAEIRGVIGFPLFFPQLGVHSTVFLLCDDWKWLFHIFCPICNCLGWKITSRPWYFVLASAKVHIVFKIHHIITIYSQGKESLRKIGWTFFQNRETLCYTKIGDTLIFRLSLHILSNCNLP